MSYRRVFFLKLEVFVFVLYEIVLVYVKYSLFYNTFTMYLYMFQIKLKINSTIMWLNVCLAFVLGFGSVCSSDFGSCTSFQLKPENFNKYLDGHTFSEIQSSNHMECAKMCMSFSICKSIDYYRHTCKLNEADSSSVHESEFTRVKGAIFSDISDWPNKMVGSCGKRPCTPKERCVPHSEDPDGKYDCIDSDFCSKVNCLHGGSCRNTAVKAVCDCRRGYTGRICETGYRDCKDILGTKPYAKSRQYTIILQESKKPVSVYCDMKTDGGGWTVFQRRFNGEVDFYRNYSEYVNGFGIVSEDFWLGLKNIQELTKQGVTELRLDMTTFNGTEIYESFQDFKLVQPDFTLQLGPSTANAGTEGLLHNNGSGFSTYDHDVDTSTGNCASSHKGAWWYKNCSKMNLNRAITTSHTCMYHSGTCLKSSSMKFRRRT